MTGTFQRHGAMNANNYFDSITSARAGAALMGAGDACV